MAGAVLADLAALRRFDVTRHLGSGGMGAVFEAFDRERRRKVALKTLRSQSPEELLQLKNEFRALSDVRHPNLVQLLELMEEDGRYFVAMELVEGQDLLSWVRPGAIGIGLSGELATDIVGSRAHVSETWPTDDASLESELTPISGAQSRLDLARLQSAFGQLALALDALHARGKLHRDVKPANVLVTAEGRAVLVDFGLALDDGIDAGAIAGTRAFMAPEQAAGQALSAAADWYSFGVALYLALFGQLPFHGAGIQRQKLRGPTRTRGELGTGASAELEALALALLSPEPSARPSGASVLAAFGVSESPVVHAGAPFVGRDRELARLSRAFDGARRQQQRALVRGDSGVGKSALAREVVARLRLAEPTLLVLSGRCYERDWLPYKALDGIVDELCQFLIRQSPSQVAVLLSPAAAILPRVFPVLARLSGVLEKLPALELPDDPQERRSLAFGALRELFIRLARSRPVLLYIDDLQWADADSHLLLAELLRGPSPPPLWVLATARKDPFDAPWLAEIGAATLELDTLSLEEGTALARAVLGGTEPALASWVARETGGHPLFIQALAGRAVRSGGARAETMRLDDVLLAQLSEVTPEARRLLELVAVSGTPLTPAVALAACAQQPAAFADQISELRARHLVRSAGSDSSGEVAPYHDRVREALLERLPPEQRRALHRDLVTALEATGRGSADPHSLVRHLEGAGEVTRAAEQAELAARRAEEALAFDQAAELYATALRLGSFGAARRLRLTLGRAEALTNAGWAAEAADAYLDAAKLSEPGERQEHERRAADHLLRSGRSEQGFSILSQVLRSMGDRFLSQRRSLVATYYERLRLRLRGSAWQPRHASEIEPEQLRLIDAYHGLSVSLSLIDPARGARFEARALRLALDAGEPRRIGVTAVMEACYEGATGSSGARGVARWSELVEQVLAHSPDPYVLACRGIRVGFLAYHAGHYAEAARVLSETEQALARINGTYFEQAFCHCFRLISLRNRGELQLLQRGYDDWVRRAQQRGDRFTEASLRFNLNAVFLARDQPELALEELSRVSWMPPEGGYHVQHWYAEQARAELALYTGNIDAGLVRLRSALSSLESSLISRLRLHRCHAHWLLVRLLLASGRHLAEVERLVEALWREDIGYARTFSLLGRAGLYARRGSRDEARSSLERAVIEADAADLPQYANAARFRLGVAERSSRFATEQRIQRPERMFGVWAPGFD